MDASLPSRAKQLADEFASQATSADDLSGLMRMMVKAALERMQNTDMDVHLGRRISPVSVEAPVSATESADQTSAGPASSIKSKPNRREAGLVTGDRIVFISGIGLVAAGHNMLVVHEVT